MRKRIALLTAAVLLLSVWTTACGDSSEEGAAGPEEQVEEVSAAPDEAQNTAAVLDAPPSDTPAADEDGEDPGEDGQDVNADAEEPSDTPEEQNETPSSTPTPTPAAVTTSAPVTTPAAVSTPTAVQVQTPAPETTPPTAEVTPEPEPPAAATREAAMAYIGSSASSMIAAIGAPSSRSYVPSCLGDGEDGELIYDGFTVYTYREGNSEIVQDVL